jgi:RNA polymerase sigma factor (sigma-70 family)
VAAGFNTTNWSIVVKAGSYDSSEARAALASLCESYWYPVYAFIRRRGHSPADAEDLTQGYFARFLEKGYARQVDPDRGRFRAFLLTSVRNFLHNERAHARALKRGGGRKMLSLDAASVEGRFETASLEKTTPEAAYEQAWAESVLSRALERLERSLRRTDRDRYPLLRAFLTGREPSEPYSRLAERWGVAESSVRVAVHGLRKRFGHVLREEVRQTVKDDADVDDELRHLLAVLGGSAGH